MFNKNKPAKPIKTIDRLSYRMEIRGGGDVWRLYGFVRDIGEYRYFSTPVSYDEETQVLKTISGSIYQVASFEREDNSEVLEQLKSDIERGSYEVH